jgi:hypothetical protein
MTSFLKSQWATRRNSTAATGNTLPRSSFSATPLFASSPFALYFLNDSSSFALWNVTVSDVVVCGSP